MPAGVTLLSFANFSLPHVTRRVLSSIKGKLSSTADWDEHNPSYNKLTHYDILLLSGDSVHVGLGSDVPVPFGGF